jgi:hypothetical protein
VDVQALARTPFRKLDSMATQQTLSQPTLRRVVPAEVNNLLTAWWLTTGLALFAGLVLWPFVIESLTGMIKGSDSNAVYLGWGGFGALAALLLGVAGLLSWRLSRGNRFSLRIYRWSILGGMIAGVGLLAGLALLMSQGYFTLGPRDSNILFTAICVLLGTAALLPFLFGLLGLSLTSKDGVLEYFGLVCPECGSTNVGAKDFFHSEMTCRAVREVEDEEGNKERAICGFTWTETPGATWTQPFVHETPEEAPEEEAAAADEGGVAVETAADELEELESVSADDFGEAASTESAVPDEEFDALLEEEGVVSAGREGGAGDLSDQLAKEELALQEALLQGLHGEEDLFQDARSGIFASDVSAVFPGEATAQAGDGLFQDAESGVFKRQTALLGVEGLFRDDQSGIFQREVAASGEASGLFRDVESGVFKQDIAALAEAAALFQDPDSGIFKHDVAAQAEAGDLFQDPDSGLFLREISVRTDEAGTLPAVPSSGPSSEIDLIAAAARGRSLPEESFVSTSASALFRDASSGVFVRDAATTRPSESTVPGQGTPEGGEIAARQREPESSIFSQEAAPRSGESGLFQDAESGLFSREVAQRQDEAAAIFDDPRSGVFMEEVVPLFEDEPILATGPGSGIFLQGTTESRAGDGLPFDSPEVAALEAESQLLRDAESSLFLKEPVPFESAVEPPEAADATPASPDQVGEEIRIDSSTIESLFPVDESWLFEQSAPSDDALFQSADEAELVAEEAADVDALFQDNRSGIFAKGASGILRSEAAPDEVSYEEPPRDELFQDPDSGVFKKGTPSQSEIDLGFGKSSSVPTSKGKGRPEQPSSSPISAAADDEVDLAQDASIFGTDLELEVLTETNLPRPSELSARRPVAPATMVQPRHATPEAEKPADPAAAREESSEDEDVLTRTEAAPPPSTGGPKTPAPTRRTMLGGRSRSSRKVTDLRTDDNPPDAE